MVELLKDMHPALQALLATIFTWGMTALGAAAVFLVKDISRRLLDGMLGFTAGVMAAASFWSLLVPSVEASREQGLPVWLPATAGFLLGAVFLWSTDKVIPHLHPGYPQDRAEGFRARSFQQSILLVLAITLHNIPEGLAIGVAFGAFAAGLPTASLAAAVALSIGIGIQNFPEGLVISLPLRGTGMTRSRSFFYGQASALVEPIAAVAGALAVAAFRPILPYALSFAAGAMIFVIIEEVIPESQLGGNTDLATMATMGGFALMTVLDLAFT